MWGLKMIEVVFSLMKCSTQAVAAGRMGSALPCLSKERPVKNDTWYLTTQAHTIPSPLHACLVNHIIASCKKLLFFTLPGAGKCLNQLGVLKTTSFDNLA